MSDDAQRSPRGQRKTDHTSMGGWVAVSDRLPDHGRVCVILARDRQWNSEWHALAYREREEDDGVHGTGEIRWWDMNDEPFLNAHHFTHWFYLPKLPPRTP